MNYEQWNTETVSVSLSQEPITIIRSWHKLVFHDKQIWQICQIWQKYNTIFKNYHNLNDKSKGYLIFPVLAILCVLHQLINTDNSKE